MFDFATPLDAAIVLFALYGAFRFIADARWGVVRIGRLLEYRRIARAMKRNSSWGDWYRGSDE